MDLIDTFFNADVLVRAMPLLITGLVTTIQLGVTSIAAGSVIGLALALSRLYGPKALRLLAVVVIDVFRAVPVLVLLILIYYALPFLGIRLSCHSPRPGLSALRISSSSDACSTAAEDAIDARGSRPSSLRGSSNGGARDGALIRFSPERMRLRRAARRAARIRRAAARPRTASRLLKGHVARLGRWPSTDHPEKQATRTRSAYLSANPNAA